MNEERAIAMLKEVKESFDKYNVVFWLDCGTLLGAVRNKGFLPNDNNINLSAMTNTHDEQMNFCRALVELKEQNFRWVNWEHETAPSLIKEDIEIEIHLVRFNKEWDFIYHSIVPNRIVGRTLNYLLWTIDLFNPSLREGYGSSKFLTEKLENFFGVIPSKIRSVLWKIIFELYYRLDTIHVESRVPGHYFSSFREISFYGLKVRIPEDIDKYLKFRYGEWRNPQGKYIGGAVVRRYLYGGKPVKGLQIYGREK